MDSSFYAQLEQTFTKSRLSVYRQDGADDNTVIKSCLKKCPSNMRAIKSLQNIFDKIRILRNRVSHYERIVHWKDLKNQHEWLLECIYWLDENAFRFAFETDVFDYLYAAGIKPFLTLVEKKWS